MDIKRLFRHLIISTRAVKRYFPDHACEAIIEAIKKSEKEHNGEICFAVEASLDLGPLLKGQTARERAIDVFSRSRVWDTEFNNGVLIYVLIADHSVEIIADRGIHARAGHDAFEQICRQIEAEFRTGRFEHGTTTGIEAVSHILAQHFPPRPDDRNELPDNIVML